MAKTAKAKIVEPVPDDEQQEESSGNWLTRLLFRPRMLVLLAIGVTSTFVLPTVVSLLPNLSGRKQYRMEVSKIEITPDAPRWVPDDLLRQVTERAGLPDSVSLLEDGLVEEIAEAFRLHPWVAEVVSVRKSTPARILVELEYRKPAAMVRMKRGMYPVDSEGTLLPPADFSVSEAQRYPIIRNVQSTPQGPAGMNWGDAGVVGAARLAEVLAPCWRKFHLQAIHVPRPVSPNTTLDDMMFELITAGGSRIIWGRAPGSSHPGELSPEKKIGRLEKYWTDFGGFDHPHGPYAIDIRHWQEISRRPLSAARRGPTRR